MDSHHPCPTYQAEPSGTESLCRDRICLNASLPIAAASDSKAASSRAPMHGMNATRVIPLAAYEPVPVRVTLSITPKPSFGVSGKISRPPTFSASSHAAGGCVAPAFTDHVTHRQVNAVCRGSPYLHIRQMSQVAFGTLGDVRLHLISQHLARGADKCCEHSCVVTRARANVDRGLALLRRCCGDALGVQGRLTIVDAPFGRSRRECRDRSCEDRRPPLRCIQTPRIWGTGLALRRPHDGPKQKLRSGARR